MSGDEFRVLMDLCMVSDPWPLSHNAQLKMFELLDREAVSRGHEDWITAYHDFQPMEVE